MDLGPPELIILLVIVLVLFGGRKLPELARSLGQAKKEFEKNADGEDEGSKAAKAASAKSVNPGIEAAAAPSAPPIVVPPASNPVVAPADDTGTVI